VRPSQSTTAPLKEGRVLAKSIVFHGMRPIASLVDGTIAALPGIRIAGLAMSLPALAGCLGTGGARDQPAAGFAVEPRTMSFGSSWTVTGSSFGSLNRSSTSDAARAPSS
jgi:hypothetical protein